jgi:hypothetical protein
MQSGHCNPRCVQPLPKTGEVGVCKVGGTPQEHPLPPEGTPESLMSKERQGSRDSEESSPVGACPPLVGVSQEGSPLHQDLSNQYPGPLEQRTT